MIQRRMSLSPEPASPVNRGEPLKTMARREPPSGFIFEIMCMEEQERAVVDARQAGAEAAVEALLLVLALDHVVLRLPLDAEGRIGQQ